MKPVNPSAHNKSDLDKFSSSGLLGDSEHQVPFALAVKVFLKRKFCSVMTGSRSGNTQQLHQVVAPYFGSGIRILYNELVIPSVPVEQAHGVETCGYKHVGSFSLTCIMRYVMTGPWCVGSFSQE